MIGQEKIKEVRKLVAELAEVKASSLARTDDLSTGCYGTKLNYN